MPSWLFNLLVLLESPPSASRIYSIQLSFLSCFLAFVKACPFLTFYNIEDPYTVRINTVPSQFALFGSQ